MADEWIQEALDVPGGPGPVKTVRHRRALPIKPCALCKKPIVQPWFAGSHDRSAKKWYAGKRIKLDPEPVPEGEFYVVSKTAHLRLPEDIHPSLVFYVEHDCIAESK